MKTVNVHEAKSTLSALLAEVEHGEEVTIARNGQPTAKLVRITQPQARSPGILRRRVGRTLSAIQLCSRHSVMPNWPKKAGSDHGVTRRCLCAHCLPCRRCTRTRGPHAGCNRDPQ